MKSLMKPIRLLSVILVSLFVLSSCISQKKVTLLRDKSGELTSSYENKKMTTYHIQSGDHLYIRIYSVDPKTSKFFQTDLPTLMNPTYMYLNSYVVDEQGYISFSFIEKMYVKGLTVEEIKTQLQKSVNDYFKEATVVVRLVDYQVAVLGEVNSPGNFTIDKDQITIFQAIGMAGGFKDYANLKSVKIVRQTLKGSDVYVVDLTKTDVLQSDYYYLMPNDVVYIQPRKGKSFAFDKFPYGEILTVASLTLTALIYLKIVK
jgi:polysaccharide biosynthesis/export protein